MALCFNFLLHLTFIITFGARTVFMGGRAISWIQNFIYIYIYIYIYQIKEKEMKEEQYAIKKKTKH